MPEQKRAEKEERLLVLVVDIDNDLYVKTKINGPLIGRVQVLNGATQLALADPEDTDANTMFKAVKVYDELKEQGHAVYIATITGAESQGYAADRELARQLEQVIDQYKPDACVFVSDGASDERALPIVESRLKVNSLVRVTVKQSENLESTYVTLLKKLEEPHYARIVFGIPAIILLMFALSYAFNLGWQLPVAIIGLYLLLKGFGLEDMIVESFKGFGFSIERMSFVFYLSALVFFFVSIFISAGNYLYELGIGSGPWLAFAYAIEGFLLLMPVAIVLYIVGRLVDVRSRRYLFRSYKYGVYAGSSLIVWVLLYALTAWLIGQIYFGQFLLFTILAILVGIAINETALYFKRQALKRRNLNNKVVINELGTLIGKVSKVDVKKGMLTVQTPFGNPIRYGIDRVVEISDRVVIG
ncbi:MAG: DUF373 family protein [Candidatus Micrarchaeia archaeon]|jgi:putative membrane protein